MAAICQAVCRVGWQVFSATRQRSGEWNEYLGIDLSGLSAFYKRRELAIDVGCRRKWMKPWNLLDARK